MHTATSLASEGCQDRVLALPRAPNPSSAPATQTVPALQGLPGTQLTLATCGCSHLPPPRGSGGAPAIQMGPREPWQRHDWAQKVPLAFSTRGSRRIEKRGYARGAAEPDGQASPSPFPLTSHGPAPSRSAASTFGAQAPERWNPTVSRWFPDGRFGSGLGKTPRILALLDPGALPRRSLPPPPSAPCALLPAPRSSSPAPLTCPPRFCRVGRRSNAPSKTVGGSVSRKGSRGASAVRRWGPLSAVETPTSPDPRGLSTGCGRTGRACDLPPPVPPPSPLSFSLPPSAPPRRSRSQSSPPPPPPPAAIHLPAPCPGSDGSRDEFVSGRRNPGPRLLHPCPLSLDQPSPVQALPQLHYASPGCVRTTPEKVGSGEIWALPAV